MTTPAASKQKRRSVLRNLIDERGIRHRFVAEKLGINPVSFFRLLEGDREVRASELLALKELLDVPHAVWFDGEQLRFVEDAPLSGQAEGPDGDE